MKYSNEELKKAIGISNSWNDVERLLVGNECKSSGSRKESFKKRAIRNRFDFSHFIGQSWNTGKGTPVYSDEEVFCNPSTISRSTVKARLMREPTFTHICEICGESEWCGKLIPLVLDHISGDRLDQRKENLRFICPNCDAQTDTFAGRNFRNRKNITDEDIADIIPKCHTINEVCRKLGLSTHRSSSERVNTLLNNMDINFKRYGKNSKSAVKPDRPSKEILEKIIWEKPVKYIAEEYEVADKTVRAWCKKYKIPTPQQGYWSKKNKQ